MIEVWAASSVAFITRRRCYDATNLRLLYLCASGGIMRVYPIIRASEKTATWDVPWITAYMGQTCMRSLAAEGNVRTST